jgi:predicted RNA polymerase sigma factor
VTAPDIHRTIDAVWRIESAKLIAGLTRVVRDVGMAEDLAQDALLAALEQWPKSGVPDNPGAWLMAIGKRRAIDVMRRGPMMERKHAEIGHEMESKQESPEPELAEALDDHVGDDLLRPRVHRPSPGPLHRSARRADLRLLGGLTTDEIARAFLAESTIVQRIVRAKRTLSDKKVPFEVPRGAELARASRPCSRSPSIFNEGYSATSGEDWCGRTCARRRCGSAASWPSSRLTSRRSTDWWP